MPHSVYPVKEENITVDILVRTFAGDEAMLEQLLVSVARFWPTERWRSTVWVVLDEESPADQALCARLNRDNLATCVLEPSPAFLAPDFQILKKFKTPIFVF